MAPPETDPPGWIQKGYRAVPVSGADQESPLRLCVIVRDAPDPTAGLFVLLRDNAESSVYLGCLADAGGYPHEWIELWIQTAGRLQTSLEAHRQALSNQLLDERWKQRATLLGQVDRPGQLELASEAVHPLPIFFDLAVSQPVAPADPATNTPWELCLDDALLKEHGLPPYSTSLARYLVLRGGAKPIFVPVTPGAPENESTHKYFDTFGHVVVPLNPEGGLMMARRFAPIAFGAYADLLGGAPWRGIEEGTKVFRLSGVYRTLQDADAIALSGAHLFLGQRGRGGRLAEAFHLKLDLLRQALGLVRDFVRERQIPFLDLSAGAFRVSLAETSATLPFLWTAKVSLASFGSAFAVPAGGGRSFTIAEAASVFRPEAPAAPVRGAATVSIGKVLPGNDETVSIEGTLLTSERIDPAKTGVLWLRLSLAAGPVDFYASPAPGTTGQCAFKTFPQKLSPALSTAIQSVGGTRFENVSFEAFQTYSSPSDLYALAVLGVRALLADGEAALAGTLDELLKLGQAAAFDSPTGAAFASHLRSVAGEDPRWAGSLGPQRVLAAADLSPEEAFASLPPELWWDTVAWLIQCFPGAVPGAFCSGFNEAPAGGLHSVFEPAIATLDQLLVRSRNLLFSDWKYDAEVNAVLKAALDRHSADSHG